MQCTSSRTQWWIHEIFVLNGYKRIINVIPELFLSDVLKCPVGILGADNIAPFHIKLAFFMTCEILEFSFRACVPIPSSLIGWITLRLWLLMSVIFVSALIRAALWVLWVFMGALILAFSQPFLWSSVLCTSRAGWAHSPLRTEEERFVWDVWWVWQLQWRQQ